MLVDIIDLEARLPFIMDADEKREAEGALADLSWDAQSIGSAKWTTPLNTPQSVKNLIVRAAARHMKNYEGYTQSRAGDETVQWAEQDTPGTATFTRDEKQMLKQMGGKMPFIGGVSVVAWNSRPTTTTQYAPTTSGSPIPYWYDGSPW